MEGVRRVFGRAPFAFPESVPARVADRRAGDVRGKSDDAPGTRAGGRFQSDRRRGRATHTGSSHTTGSAAASSRGRPDLGAYAYGAYFHQFLADRYGTESLNELADASSGGCRFSARRRSRRCLAVRSARSGTIIGPRDKRAAVPASETDGAARRLTHEGFTWRHPGTDGDGTVYYATDDPHRFPALKRLPPDGRPQRARRRACSASARPCAATGSSSISSNGAVHRALLRFVCRERPTAAARAGSPSRRAPAIPTCLLTADGSSAPAEGRLSGRRGSRFSSGSPDDADGHRRSSRTRTSPGRDGLPTDVRWSCPDGNAAATIWSSSTSPRVTCGRSSARADVRLITPSWTPDGRTILFAANVGDEPFNVYAVSVDDGRVRRVTDSVSGATAPEVSPDGRRLLYLGYTLGGYDLFDIPYEPDAWQPIEWPMTSEPSARPASGSAIARFISPVAISGSDLLVAGGRERRRRAADWCRNGDERCARPSCVRRRRSMERRRGVPDWHASYAYDRWWPTMFAAYSDDTDPTSLGDSRTRQLLTGALLPIRHVRWAETGLAALECRGPTRSAATRVCSQVRVHRQLGSIRTGWIHDSRRQFGYSISAEEGVQVEGAVDAAIGPLGSDADSTSVVLDVRGFQRVLGRHTVVAGRVAFAGASGPPQGRRLFSAAGPGPSVAAFDFGRDTIGLLRGVAAEDVVGSRAAVANVDLRFPLAYPERGFGSWPIFLQILALGHLRRCRSGVGIARSVSVTSARPSAASCRWTSCSVTICR